MASLRTDDFSNPDQFPVLSVAELSLSQDNSVAVVSEACKFVLPVPNLGQQADPLVYPEGHPQAGKAIVDYKGRPVGDRGLIFFNDNDRAWQAVPADGTGVIIVNEILPDQAAKLDAKVRSLTHTLAGLSLSQLKEILAYVRLELKLCDTYNSNCDYVASKLINLPIPGGIQGFENPYYGLKKRDGEDIYQAAYIPVAFKLTGTTMTEQIFPNGGIIIEQQGKVRGLQKEVFIRTYRLVNAQAIKDVEDDLPILNIQLT